MLTQGFLASWPISSPLATQSSVIIENGLSGFSATLLQELDAEQQRIGPKILAIRGTDGHGDLLVDLVNVGLAGSTTLNPQYIALRDYIGVPSADANLLGTGNFTVTGHSLVEVKGSDTVM